MLENQAQDPSRGYFQEFVRKRWMRPVPVNNRTADVPSGLGGHGSPQKHDKQACRRLAISMGILLLCRAIKNYAHFFQRDKSAFHHFIQTG